jgi:hypothetical protein
MDLHLQPAAAVRVFDDQLVHPPVLVVRGTS